MERFHPRLTMACSFQKEESVLVHMLTAIEPERPRVHDRHRRAVPGDARDLEAVRGALRASRSRCSTRRSPDEPWTAEHCCSAAKVDALEHALADVDAWITGIRREQATTRTRRDQARARRAARDLEGQPARRLEREGRLELHLQARSAVPSAPRSGLRLDRLCSVHAPGEGREGRWAGQDKTECGIHT